MFGNIERHRVALTTDAGGAATDFTVPVNGAVLEVIYTPHPTTPLDTGADLDITGETTGLVIANHDNIGLTAFTRSYRQATHNADGSAATYAAGGTGVLDFVYVAGERLKIVIAAGGNVKSGTFDILIGT